MTLGVHAGGTSPLLSEPQPRGVISAEWHRGGWTDLERWEEEGDTWMATELEGTHARAISYLPTIHALSARH